MSAEQPSLVTDAATMRVAAPSGTYVPFVTALPPQADEQAPPALEGWFRDAQGRLRRADSDG